MADQDRWGENVLREYKSNPWVFRQHKKVDYKPQTEAEAKSKIILTINEIPRGDETYLRVLTFAIAALLGISPEVVSITSMEQGSVKITIELPEQNANQLVEIYEKKDPELDKYLAPLVLLDLSKVVEKQGMKPIPIDSNGRIDLNAIESLKLDDLKEWVSRRLAGDDPYFPLSSHWAEEDPKSVFLWAWKQTDPASPYRERLAKSLGDLLEPALRSPENFTLEWLYELFSLAAMLKIPFDAIKLKQAFDNRIFHREPYLGAKIDRALLSVLAAQDAWFLFDFWHARLEEPRYARTAIFALEAFGFKAITAAFPKFLKTYVDHRQPDKISIVLIDLVETYGIQALEEEVFTLDLPSDLYDAAAKALAPYNIALGYSDVGIGIETIPDLKKFIEAGPVKDYAQQLAEQSVSSPELWGPPDHNGVSSDNNDLKRSAQQ
jgi:hypothetical protein